MIIYRDLINAVLTQKTIHTAAKFLKPHYFNGQGNTRLVYDYIREYYKEYQEVPEPAIVKAKFPEYEFEERFGNINEYIKIIQKDIYHREYMDNIRKMVLYGNELKENTMSTKEVHRMSLSLIGNVSDMINEESEMIDIGKNATQFMERYHEKKSGIGCGIPTYIPELDEHYVMFAPGHLIYVFARPGAGKTWSIIHMAKEMWKNGYRPLILSYEMDEHEVDERAVCLEAGVNYSKLVTGRLNQHDLMKVQRKKNEWAKSGRGPFLVANPIDEDTTYIESKIIETNADVVFIDYIHLIANKEKYMSKIEAIEAKSKELKQIGKRRKVPMIVINHSNREFARYVKDQGDDTDKNYLPQLENIADADGCGKDADMVIGLHAIPTEDKNGNKFKTVHIGVVKGRFSEECQTTIKMDIKRGIFEPTSLINAKEEGMQKTIKETPTKEEELKIAKEEFDQSGLGVHGGIDTDTQQILNNRQSDDSDVDNFVSMDDSDIVPLEIDDLDDIDGLQ